MMTLKRIGNWTAEISNRPWFNYGLLVLITLLTAALRFYKLGEWSFWIDEIYTVNHAMAHFSTPQLMLEHLPPNRNWVPVSVILTAQVFNMWGINEFNGRLVAAIVGVLTVPVLYFPIRKIFNARVALITVLLLAVAPWHIFWSQNARFYTSLMLFYSLALFTFYFAIERDRPLYFVVFYVLFYLAMSERMIALLLVPVIVVYLLSLWLLPFEKPAGFRVQNILILSAPIIAFLAYEVYLFAATGDFIFASDLDLLAPPVDTPIRLLIVIAFSIGLPILCLAFFNGIYLLMKKERAGLFFFIASVLPPLLIALANPFVFTVERYAFMTLLFWVALAAGGVKALFTLAGKQGTVLALGVFFILLADAAGSSLMYYQINHGNRLDWRDSVEYVRERMEEGDIVVSTRAPLASYYLGENTLEFKDLLAADLEKIDAPIWFIMEYPGIWHGREGSMAWIEEHAQLLRYSYLRLMEANYMLIYRFDPTQAKNP